MAQAIMGQGQNSQKTNTRWNPRGQTQGQGQRDPNAMDIRALTPEERTRLMKIGGCFRCRKPSHLAKDCPGPNATSTSTPNMTPPPQKKWTVNEIKTMIRNLETKDMDELTNLINTDF